MEGLFVCYVGCFYIEDVEDFVCLQGCGVFYFVNYQVQIELIFVIYVFLVFLGVLVMIVVNVKYEMCWIGWLLGCFFGYFGVFDLGVIWYFD